MFFDSHVHISPFSHDARQSVHQLLNSAASRGLAGVMTSDHYEKGLYYEGVEDVFDIQSYFDVLSPHRQNRSGCQLRIGCELGYLPEVSRHLADVAKTWPFDGLILSLHILEGTDPYTSKELYQEEKTRLYRRFIRQMTRMLAEFPDFDILGHFDYITRYGNYADRKMYYLEQADELDELFQLMAKMDKALEINIRTVSKLREAGYTSETCWPDRDIVRRFLELGNRKIILGSDAHQPADVGHLFSQGAAWLKSLGCRHLVHYENRQAIMDPLE
jgi:histidinol-phosphatase (PHP family)